MKKIIIIAMLVLIPIIGNAENKNCNSMAEFAKTIMQLRQGGAPINEVMNFIESAEDKPEVYKVMKSITIMAYDTPRYSTPSIKEKTINEFYNTIYVNCIK